MAKSKSETWAQIGSMAGWVYLLQSDCDQFRKFGVTIHASKRLSEHRRCGLGKVLQLLELPNVGYCYEVERLIKAELAADGVTPALSGSQLRSGGATETYRVDDAPFLTLTPFVEIVLARAADRNSRHVA